MSTQHSFTVRPATSRDEAAVLALVPRPCAVSNLRRHCARPKHWTRASNALCVASSVEILRARAYGSPTTTAQSWAWRTQNRATDYFTQESHGHLGILAVAEHAEGRGIGKALLETVERWSRNAGFRFLSLNVFADNARAIGVVREGGVSRGLRPLCEAAQVGHFDGLTEVLSVSRARPPCRMNRIE